jgi:tripartite-type tricarboxylate transporter receptor subunit TctC
MSIRKSCRGSVWPALMVAAVAMFAACATLAQTFPSRPVRFMVPWPPGGGIDISARALQPKLAELLGQSVIIDNRPGAAGMMGTQMAARAPADGHTILLGAAGPNAIVPLAMPKQPYEPRSSFAEVAHFANTVYVFSVHAASPITSIRELIAMAKSHPGKVTAGVTGTATPAHIAGEYMRVASRVSMTTAVYKGAAAPLLAVMGGEINVSITTISPALPQFRAGKVRLLAVTSGKRVSQAPDVPTLVESGFPGLEIVNWYGVLAPAGTPTEIIARLHRDVTGAVRAPEVRERLVAAGLELVESTPAEYAAYRRRDLAMWARMIKETGIRME